MCIRNHAHARDALPGASGTALRANPTWCHWVGAGLMVTPIGIGAWSWGDRSGYWGYGEGYQKEDNFEAFKGMVGSGIGLIDTAEVWPHPGPA